MTPEQFALLESLTPEWAKSPPHWRHGRIKNIQGNVYFAQALVGGPVKVGFSVNLKKRLGEQRYRWCPPLILVAAFGGTHRDENRVHRALVESRRDEPRIGGRRGEIRYWDHGREWFLPTAATASVVEAFGGRLLIDPLPPAVLRARLECAERDARELRAQPMLLRQRRYAEWLRVHMGAS